MRRSALSAACAWASSVVTLCCDTLSYGMDKGVTMGLRSSPEEADVGLETCIVVPESMTLGGASVGLAATSECRLPFILDEVKGKMVMAGGVDCM